MDGEIRSNIDIVVFILANLGGTTRKITTETIAYEAFKIRPNRFSWSMEEYKGIPDKEVARLALEDAAKRKNGTLVRGKYARDLSKDGWILTPNGVRWLKENIHRIESALNIEGSEKTKLSPRDIKRFRARFLQDQVYNIYQTTGSLKSTTRFMFTDLLQCSPDASPDIIRSKFDQIMNQAELAQDKNILDFLRVCEIYFQEILAGFKE